jgi:hypothetical protein
MTPGPYWCWRFYAESLMEQAITILDAIDRDAELEDGRDGEPSLASPVRGESQPCWSARSNDDREHTQQPAA